MRALLGGNVGSISNNRTGLNDVYARLDFLRKGHIARTSALFEEVFWTANPETPNFTNLEVIMEYMGKNGLIPSLLVGCAADSRSLWYPGSNYNNIWFIREDKWELALECFEVLCRKIVELAKKNNIRKLYIELHNEPSKGKPGGSNETYINIGSWDMRHHNFFYKQALIASKYFKLSQIIGPAISCFGEPYSEVSELISCMPPKEYDWNNLCGFRNYHIRLGDGGCSGNLDNYTKTINRKWQYFLERDKLGKFPVNQRIAITELYVSVGDCGFQNINNHPSTIPFKREAYKLVDSFKSVSIVLPYGLLDVDYDLNQKDNVWFNFGENGRLIQEIGPTLIPNLSRSN